MTNFELALLRAALLALGAAFGASLGSFAGVVIDRLTGGRTLLEPPSACTDCGVRIAPRDNVPVVSWLLLRGRCRACGATIPARLLILEVVGAAAGMLAASRL